MGSPAQFEKVNEKLPCNGGLVSCNIPHLSVSLAPVQNAPQTAFPPEICYPTLQTSVAIGGLDVAWGPSQPDQQTIS